MPRVYVGAGSNLGAAERLRGAVAALERAFGTVHCSSVYSSAAVGAAAPDYLNLVAAFDSERPAGALKSELGAIEAALGRTREREPVAGGSALCALDLDLLMHGSRVDAELRLPHPDLLRRAFVLAPSAELAPNLRHPVSGERLDRAWARLAASLPAIERIGSLSQIRARTA
jgi:2-amino-4-hydroxy-6-hydroxymethyldihydropteridine diphosphokinase